MTAEDEMVGWRHRLNGQSLSKLWEMVKERTEEPGVLQSMGSQRVGHNLATEQQVRGWFFYLVEETEAQRGT